MGTILTDYPDPDVTYPIDASRLQGRLWRIWARNVIAARRNGDLDQEDARLASSPENAPETILGAVASVPDAGQITMRELTPPIQSDKERGEGDSVNARLHRLLRGRQ